MAILILYLITLIPLPLCALDILVYSNKDKENLGSSITRFPSPPSINFIDISFCFWIKQDNLKSANILYYKENDTRGFGFTLQQDYGFIKIKEIDLLFDYLTPPLPGRWRHFCSVYTKHEQSLAIYLDGELTFSRVNLDMLQSEFHPSLLQHLTLGDGKEKFGQPMSGELTLVRIWSRGLNSEEVLEEARCGQVNTQGMEVDWVVSKMGRGESVMLVDRPGGCPLHMEETKARLVGFQKRVKFQEAGIACEGLGGRQVNPATLEDLIEARDSFSSVQDCNSKFWVPVKQRQGSWVDVTNGNIPSYLPWKLGQPNGLHYQACTEAKFNKTTQEMDGYNDLNCNKSVRCFYCSLPSSSRFTLRGLCKEAAKDVHFLGDINTVDSNRPHWSGYRSFSIDFSGDFWQLKDQDSGQTLATTNSSLWPVGRNTWDLEEGVCGPKQFRTLVLTSCSLDHEMTCNDGTCRPLKSRCDGAIDCPEQEDEAECTIVQYPRDRQYMETLPPYGRTDEGEVIPADVIVSVGLQEVGDIKEVMMSYTAKMSLSMTWTEDRVQWRGLRNNSNINRVPYFSIQTGKQNIWVPVIIFSNTPKSDQTLMDLKAALTVEKKGRHEPSPLDQEQEMAYYTGRENPVTYTRTFMDVFSCIFNLEYYPFDTQVCTIQLQTPKHVKDLVRLRTGELSYQGPKDLIQFTVLDWSITEVEEGVEVSVRFRRRIQHHLLSTFLPTFCLMLIAQSGLYFRAEHFKTTAAVSVTVMLVLFTLYQAVSTKVTPTAYIKMIDIWLIFGLVLPFIVFFLLVSIDHLPSPPVSPEEEKPQTVWRLKNTLQFFAHFILPLIIIMFALTYGIAAAIIYNS